MGYDTPDLHLQKLKSQSLELIARAEIHFKLILGNLGCCFEKENLKCKNMNNNIHNNIHAY